jgi:hypothetical protein
MESSPSNVLRITVVALAITILFGLRMPRSATVLGFQDPPGNGRVRSDQNFPEQDPSRERDAPRQPSDRPADDGDLVTLPSGSLIHVRISDEVNSSHDKAGALYTGTVDPSVLVHDHVVIPRGTEAHIRLVEVKKGGHLHGKAKVRLELVSLIMNGERLGVETNQPSKKEGSAHAKVSAEARKAPDGASVTTGNPAAFAGPVIAAFSAAKVDVKPGSRIEFTLEAPFTFEPPPVQASQP